MASPRKESTNTMHGYSTFRLLNHIEVEQQFQDHHRSMGTHQRLSLGHRLLAPLCPDPNVMITGAAIINGRRSEHYDRPTILCERHLYWEPTMKVMLAGITAGWSAPRARNAIHCYASIRYASETILKTSEERRQLSHSNKLGYVCTLSVLSRPWYGKSGPNLS